ncbi:glycosyl transferase [Nonlabens ulvanivorans]|nr:glycosyltransferase [Nonlabens ulvanivorans]GAK93152.1 glycosyl transferase [Nonlabens ulvanivorans]
MKILIVNTYDTGGAANACLRLHNGLLKEGVSSKLLLLHKTKNTLNSFQFERNNIPKHEWSKRLEQLKFRIGNKFNIEFLKRKKTDLQIVKNEREAGLDLYSLPYSDFDITQSDLFKEADLINLHWVAGFLDYKSFFKNLNKPIIWTLHDMNAFTGGEHYLEKFNGVNKHGLPRLRNVSSIEKSYSAKYLNVKMDSLTNFDNLTIVSPSKWLQNEAKQSTLFQQKTVHLIPYGLDIKLFHARDKSFSRELFDIPLDKKVILFVADSVDNGRKGFIYLKNALELLKDDDVICCSIGKNMPDLESTINIHHLGYFNDERIISLIYSLADVFVIPSIMDNLPNTVLESLLCGIPVIGFPVGGIPDMIDEGKNGLIASELSVESLKNTIEKFLTNGVELTRNQIRENAVDKYDESIQATKYVNLFKEILSNK